MFKEKRLVQVAGDSADPAGLASDSRVLGWPAACSPFCFYLSFSLLGRGRERLLQEDMMWPGLFPTAVICTVSAAQAVED